MKNAKRVKVLFILITVFIVTACNLPIPLGEKTEGDLNGSGDVTEIPTQEIFDLEVDPNPVALQEGLGSFDSYLLTIYLYTASSKGTYSEVTETIERAVAEKNQHTTTVQRSFDPENDEEEYNSTEEGYIIGNASCSGSGEEWTYEEMTAQEKELMEIFKGMIDFLPTIDNPLFIGEETINGVETNHFTFQVAGIGDDSGSVAKINQGDYWLAKDGNYMVKYHLKLEIQSAAEGTEDAEVSNLEFALDLNNINIPITFVMPAYCVPTSE